METSVIKTFLFSTLIALAITLPQAVLAEEKQADKTIEDLDLKHAPQFGNKNSLEDKLMENIPLAKELKPVWHLVSGDTDIFVPNLRVDRGNKGLIYKTNTIPFIGDLEGLDLKFRAGDDMKFSLETSIIPFVGNIQGLNIKGSVGEESQIFARYTIALD